MSSPEPVSIKRICEVIGDITSARIRQAIADLNNLYMGCGNSFRIRDLAGGYQIYILPDFEQQIKQLLVKQKTVRLSQPALEALAIVAYKQPVTRTEIEHIRGVASDGVMHTLIQRNLISLAGRADAPGRPLLYKTSKEFLKYFGLDRLSDLPRIEEIEELIRQSETNDDQTVLALGEAMDDVIERSFPGYGDGPVDGEIPAEAASAMFDDSIPFSGDPSMERDFVPILQTGEIPPAADETKEDNHQPSPAEESKADAPALDLTGRLAEDEDIGALPVMPMESENMAKALDPSDHSEN